MAGGTWQFGAIDGEGLSLTPAGGIALVGGDAAVRQSIILLLSTVPGERIMRPSFGCPLHRLVFSPNDETNAGLAIHYVRRALTRFEPRVEILHLRAAADDAALRIRLDYRVRASGGTDTLTLTLDPERP
jgi:phage baseplate assembly protein W